ncbi:MAG: hypothetical protein ACAF41_34305 (plasmid) [Leptolyngbya sp. BL-A-14]
MKWKQLAILLGLLPLCLALANTAQANCATGRGAVPKVTTGTTLVARAPCFTTNAQLEAKFRQVKIGWTYAQVEALLGPPQWGGRETGIYNYFVNQRTLIKVINFKGGRVSGFSRGAG